MVYKLIQQAGVFLPNVSKIMQRKEIEMGEMVIKISPDGKTAVLLHSDTHPLIGEGRQELARASNVLFDEEDQLWYVHENVPKGGTFRHDPGFVRRADAIEFEVNMLNWRLEHLPDSVDAVFEDKKKEDQRLRLFETLEEKRRRGKAEDPETSWSFIQGCDCMRCREAMRVPLKSEIQVLEDEMDVGLD